MFRCFWGIHKWGGSIGLPEGRGLDRAEESDELLVSVALHAAADNSAFEHVEGGEESGGVIALNRHGADSDGVGAADSESMSSGDTR
jgi:hypothetical protein